MSNRCYMCGPNSESPDSLEHIIPDSLGSRLQSMGILCLKHNNEFGGDVDGELFNQVGFLSDMMGLNGKNKRKVLTAIDSKNEPYKIGSGMKGLFQVYFVLHDIKETPIEIQVTGNTLEELKRKAEKLVNSHKANYSNYQEYITRIRNLKIEDLTENVPEGSRVNFTNEISTNPKAIRLQINPKMTKAFIKIALNFYFFKGCDKQYVNEMVDTLKLPDEKINLQIQQVRLVAPFSVSRDLKSDEISHVITIEGNSADGYLVAYIELFCWVRVLVFMNLRYTGKTINEKYGFNLLEKSKFIPDVKIKVSKNDMLNMQFNNDDSSFLSDGLTRVYEIFNDFQLKNKKASKKGE